MRSSRLRRLSAYGVLLAGLFLASACGGPDAAADGPVIRGYPADADLPGAQVTGTLERSGDCLRIGDAVPVWSEDASWDADATAVELDGERHAVGSEVRLGGGYYSDGEWDGVVAENAVAPIRACLDSQGLDTVVLVG